jgi:putative intracellular protease/amidase
VEDGGGGDVDALGDLGVPMAGQLHAQQPPGDPVAGDADGDAVAAGIVGPVSVGDGSVVTGPNPDAMAWWSRRPVRAAAWPKIWAPCSPGRGL